MTTIDVPHSSRSAVLTVSGVIEETPDSRSLVFDVPADMKSKFQYKPGQFLTLRIPSDQTGSVARCYSLASSPFTDDAPKVTVKRTADGYGSNWLCDNLKVGDQLEVLPPAGVFTPKSLDHDFLLFGGGSGITPVMSILKSALTQGGGKVVLLYGNRDVESVIFAAELRELAAKYPDRLTIIHWIETVQGLPSVTQLATLVSPVHLVRGLHVWPRTVHGHIHEALAQAGCRARRSTRGLQLAERRPVRGRRARKRSPPRRLPTRHVEIELDGEKHNLSWPRKQTIVDVMLSKGLGRALLARRASAAPAPAPSSRARSPWSTPASSTRRISPTATSWAARPSRCRSPQDRF